MADTQKKEVDVEKLIADAVANATAAIGEEYKTKIEDLTNQVKSLKSVDSKGKETESGKVTKTKPTGKVFKATYVLGNKLAINVKGHKEIGELAHLGIVNSAGSVGLEPGKAIPVTQGLKDMLEAKYKVKELNKYKVGNTVKYHEPSKKDDKYIELCPFEFEETSLKDLGL